MKKLTILIRLILLFTLLAGCSSTPKANVTNLPNQLAQDVTIVKTTLPETSQPTPDSKLTGLLKRAGAPAPVVVQSEINRQAGGAIEVKFDQPMNPDTTAAALQVTGQDGAKVAGKVTWPDTALLRFQPDQALKPGSIYQVRLMEKATSAGGAALGDTLRLDLSTSDTLGIAQVFPADGTQGVAPDSVITVVFNRPVVPLRIAEEQKDLPQPLKIEPPVEGKGEWANTSVFIFHPAQPLKGNVTYKVTIAAGLADASGASAPLLADYSWSFQVMPPTVDWLKIKVGENKSVALGEENSADAVALDPQFSLHFFQAMDRASTSAALTLTPDGGTGVPLNLTWSDDNQSLTFSPTNRLALGTIYRISLSTAALAVNGSPLGKTETWGFRTVDTPSILSTSPANGTSNADFQFEIRFASPMKIKSIIEHVSFDPPLDASQNNWYDQEGNRILFYGLKSSTDYQVKIQPGMEDLYGNAIQSAQTVRFRTRAQDPQAWLLMPDRAQFRAGAEEVFYTRFVNVSTATFSLYRMTVDEVNTMLKNARGMYGLPQGDPLWKQTVPVESAQDKVNLFKMPLGGPNGQALEKGFYLIAMDAPGVTQGKMAFADARLVTIADANLMLKVAPTEAVAWVTGLDSGEPLAGIGVKFFDQGYNLVGEAQTGADGLARLSLPNIYPQIQYIQAVVDDGEHFAYADANWGAGVSPSDYGVWEQYYEAPRPEVVYAYTDRPIYRPGQPVYFKGILRQDDDLHYTLPETKQVEVVIHSYEDTVHDETLPVSDWGTFNGSFTLDPEAALGTYSIEVKYPGAKNNTNEANQYPGDINTLGSVNFNVAEYRRPEFQVKLNAAPTDVLAGEEFSANLKADYYSGGGVAQADVQWTLRSEAFSFTPPAEFSRYNFTDFDRDSFDYLQPAKKTDNLLAEGTGKTDAQGRLTLTLPAKLKTDASQRLVLETTVTDLSGMAVSGRAEVVAHRSAVYPGARFDGYIGQAGKEQRIDLVALDWSGKPVAGQPVDVQVVERRWHSVQEQDEQGNLKWTSSVEEIPVTEFKDVALDGEGKGSVTFTPPNGGVFKAKVTARDSRGNLGTASDMIWVAGEEFIPWRQTNNRSFQLVTDKTEYQPGETAEVLIASPFQGEAYALLTVERGKVRQQEVIKLESNSTVYRLPVSADMAPNVYISVVVVKGIDENNPRPNYKIGITEIKVTTGQQVLKVQVQADKLQAGPGEQVTYTVQTTGSDGQPVQAEVSLGLSDLATLSLAPPNTQPIEQGFYDRHGLRVRTSMALINSIEDYNANLADYLPPEGRGGGSGGGKGEGDLGVMEVRQDFPDTAFWQADVRTDANGKAQVTVRLPDNLTTWRMDARAVTLDTRVGQTISDLVSSKPLLLRPQTPRFFVAGDQVTLGAAVHNNTAEDLKVTAQLAGQGITIDGAAAQDVNVPAGQQVYVTWRGRVAEEAQNVDLTFSAKGTGASGATYSDASKPTIGSAGTDGLPVYRYEAPETVATSGQLTERGSLTEGILLPQTMPVNQGELTVSVAPSLSASLTDGLTYLEHYPYECTEQTISRFLPNVLVTRVLREAGQSDPVLEANLKAQVQTAMQRLSSWQHEDGGWGWWKQGQSDEQITAYAVLGLLEAREAGYEVPALMLNNGLFYLADHEETLPNSASLDPAIKANRQAFILYVLSRAGNYNPALVGRLYDARLKLDLYARALLMRAMANQDASDPRLATLSSDFNNAAVVSASGVHWEEAQADVWNWNSDTRTTAIVLGTLVRADPLNKLTANAVRWLMSHRTEGRWASTQETAWTLMALADWMRFSGDLKADYRYIVGLNGTPLATGQASPQTLRQVQTLKVSVADLLKDQVNQLVVAREEGQGNLYYTANLKVYLPVPQIQALDKGMILSREYYRMDNPTTSVTQAKQGDLLRARLTVIAPKALHYVVITDPLAAGLEGVDASLQTSPQGEQPEAFRWQDVNETGWGWWYFDHIEMRDEKVVFSAGYLPAGTYVFTYTVRASTPGTFNVIPPTGQEFYFPEVYGRGSGSTFEVK